METPTTELAPFQDIYVEYLPYLRSISIGFDCMVALDWWPKKVVQERAASLLESNYVYVYWETKKGTLHTVQELYKNRDSLERQSAIWIMASIWDKEKRFPDDWKGGTFQLLEDLFILIRQTFPEISAWYHACRDALPISIGTYYPACDFIHPKTYRHLVYLSAIETSIILSNWQLVRFIPKQE